MGKNLTSENVITYLKQNHFPRSDDLTIELMCHPGDKSDFFDEFNQSEERVQEKNFLLNDLDSLID